MTLSEILNDPRAAQGMKFSSKENRADPGYDGGPYTFDGEHVIGRDNYPAEFDGKCLWADDWYFVREVTMPDPDGWPRYYKGMRIDTAYIVEERDGKIYTQRLDGEKEMWRTNNYIFSYRLSKDEVLARHALIQTPQPKWRTLAEVIASPDYSKNNGVLRRGEDGNNSFYGCLTCVPIHRIMEPIWRLPSETPVPLPAPQFPPDITKYEWDETPVPWKAAVRVFVEAVNKMLNTCNTDVPDLRQQYDNMVEELRRVHIV